MSPDPARGRCLIGRAPSLLRCLLTVFLIVVASGCAADPWAAYDLSLYTVLREPSAETYAAHLELLLRLIEVRESRGEKPPPGICAECAFYLHRAGRTSEAANYLAKEKLHYPESAQIVAAEERLISGRRAIQLAPEASGEGNAP